MARTMAELVAGLAGVVLTGNPSLQISQVTADSRDAGPGVLFVAVRGSAGDGHRFVLEALARGAAAVAVETDYVGLLPPETPVVRCENTRHLPALLARALHGAPDAHLWTAAVTGTNGKTTTAFLLQELLRQIHGPCGMLGTICYDDGASVQSAPLTTPGGPDFYGLLARMKANGCRSVAMELSSHALAQQRAAGLGLDVAVMTNIGRDHLDYHGDIAEYLAAKTRIMALLRVGTAGVGTGQPGVLVINAGDPALAGLDTGDCPVIRFSCDPSTPADLQVTASSLTLAGTQIQCIWQDNPLILESPLVGRFNVENLLAALAAGIGLGLDPMACAAALSGVQQVPGRLERLALPNGAIAVVDYAHTADAMQAVLGACAELTSGRLLLVFGCGGDRDRGKRALMAAAAADGADRVWITADNPRSEDPVAICDEIWRGFRAVSDPRAVAGEVIVDRRVAVHTALTAARRGDVVIVAGKGHEDYQLVGDEVLALDDRQLVRDWVAAQSGAEEAGS